MKVWLLVMLDGEGGVGSRVFSTVEKAKVWVAGQCEEPVGEWTGDDENCQIWIEELEVTFFLTAQNIDSEA